jgi:predicted dehydrogenase
MNILVIGGGSIGKRHLKNLLAIGEKAVAMVEPNTERAAANAKEFGVPIFPSVDAAFAEQAFDTALVCSPSVYHGVNASDLLKRGCDVFVEKPLSHTAADVDDLVRLAKEARRITMVGSNWKFYPSFQKIKELLGAGAIGRVLSARCQFGFYLPDWHPWEDYRNGYSANKKLGGGILLDSHEFDYLPWFLGDRAEMVGCIAGKGSDLDIDVEDTAEVIFRFAKGTIAEMHLDYTQRFYQRNFEFFGETGTILWDTNAKAVVLKTKDAGEQVFSLEDGYDINAMYVEEIKHFFACVRERKETVTPFASGAQTVKYIEAAKQSSEKSVFVRL